jgi:hypothetical protein
MTFEQNGFTAPQHLPGMPAWAFEYDKPDGVYGIVLHGSDRQAIIVKHCVKLPGLRLIGAHGGLIRHGKSPS